MPVSEWTKDAIERYENEEMEFHTAAEVRQMIAERGDNDE